MKAFQSRLYEFRDYNFFTTEDRPRGKKTDHERFPSLRVQSGLIGFKYKLTLFNCFCEARIMKLVKEIFRNKTRLFAVLDIARKRAQTFIVVYNHVA